MTITPTLWKGLSQVNTTDGGKNQFNPQITPLQNGGYVVVWVDANRPDNPAGQAVMGQVYDFLGNKVGGEVKLSLATGLHNAPSVTTLTNGNIAVAFQDDTNDNIHVRVFGPALNLVRTDSIDVDASAESNPTITALLSGGYAVIYKDSSILPPKMSMPSTLASSVQRALSRLRKRSFPTRFTVSSLRPMSPRLRRWQMAISSSSRKRSTPVRAIFKQTSSL